MTCIALGIILSVSHTDVAKIIGDSAQEIDEPSALSADEKEWSNG